MRHLVYSYFAVTGGHRADLFTTSTTLRSTRTTIQLREPFHCILVKCSVLVQYRVRTVPLSALSKIPRPRNSGPKVGHLVLFYPPRCPPIGPSGSAAGIFCRSHDCNGPGSGMGGASDELRLARVRLAREELRSGYGRVQSYRRTVLVQS